MNNCSNIQQAFRDRFDLGEDLTGFAEDHIAACPTCAGYRDELNELAHELAVFDLDFATDDISVRVMQHVRERGIDHSLRIGDYAVIGLVAAVASIAAGWYMPPWIEPMAWWSQATAWAAQADSMYSMTAWLDRTEAIRVMFDSALSSEPMMSQPIIWTTLTVSCIGAVAFNGFMAVRMRTAGD